MAVIAGSIPVTGFIAPTDSADEYPVIDPRFGIDGLRSVANVAARNAIPAGLRREGMVVYCADTKLYYKLGSNLTTWDLFVSSSSSPSVNLPVDTDVFYPRKSDVDAALALKADQSSVNAALALKADQSSLNTALALKADQSSLNTALALKANTASVNAALALKANSSNVDLALSEKANLKDVSDALALKANQVDMDEALNLKANVEDLDNAVSEYTYLNNSLREEIQADHPTYFDLGQSLNYINASIPFNIPKPSLKVVKGTFDAGNLNDRLFASFDFADLSSNSGLFTGYNPQYWLFRFNTGSRKSALDPNVRIKTKKWRHPSNSEGLGNEYDGSSKYGGVPSMSNFHSPHINVPFNRFTELPIYRGDASFWQELSLEPNLWFACEVDKSSPKAPSPWPYGSANSCKVHAPVEFTDTSWQTSIYPFHDFTPCGRRQNLYATYNQNTGTPKKQRRFNQLFRIAIVIDNPNYRDGESDLNTRKIIGPYSDVIRLRIQAKNPNGGNKKLAFQYFL